MGFVFCVFRKIGGCWWVLPAAGAQKSASSGLDALCGVGAGVPYGLAVSGRGTTGAAGRTGATAFGAAFTRGTATALTTAFGAGTAGLAFAFALAFAFTAGRHGGTQFFFADLAVAILVEGLQGRHGVVDFLGGDFAILVGIQRGEEGWDGAAHAVRTTGGAGSTRSAGRGTVRTGWAAAFRLGVEEGSAGGDGEGDEDWFHGFVVGWVDDPEAAERYLPPVDTMAPDCEVLMSSGSPFC